MENLPPQNSEPDKTPPSAQSEQEALTRNDRLQESQYREYPSPVVTANPAQAAPGTPPTPPGAHEVAPQSVQPQAQPGYTPVTPQPGYIPMTPQPGYVPPTPQPGYPMPTGPLPGYPPTAQQPGYMPPPVYAPMPPQPPAKRNWLAIASVVLAALLLLAVILGGVLVDRQGTSTTTTNTPTTSSTAPSTGLGQPTSAFTTTSCPFQVGSGVVEGQQLTCGYVTVPEDHSVKNGPTIKLAVAIFKASQYMNSVDPDPVLRLDGGPGGPSLSGWAQYVTSADYSQLIFNHNVIMFDQRGTGYSTPSLQCPELIALQDTSIVNGQQTYEQAAHTCYNRLEGNNIDLNDFNTIQNAGDVADIVHALGYKQMTLYGVSYGTRLALTTMRLYPSAIRSVILDSVYPTNHNRNELPEDAQRVFTTLFQGCAKDANCNAKYPNLQTTFYNLVDQLNAHPIKFNTVDATTNKSYTIPFAGDDLVGFLFSALYATPFIPMLPQTIYQIKAGNYTQLSELYGEVGFDDTFSDGFFYSAECSEDWPYLTQQDITASEQNIDPHIAKVFGQDDEEQEYAVCQFWKVNKVPAAQKQPVVSSLPALVLTGEYDPITPPALGQEVAKKLSHSYFFTFPGQGHGQQYSSACSDQIIMAFEDNPNQAPDSTCISQMSEPQFV